MMWFILAIFAAIFETAAILVEKKTLIKEHSLEFFCLVSLFGFVISFDFVSKVDFDLSFNIFSCFCCCISFYFFRRKIKRNTNCRNFNIGFWGIFFE